MSAGVAGSVRREGAALDALGAVERFGAAFDRQDVEAVLAAMTSDCLFESTAPPSGVRAVGKDAVRAAFTAFFSSSVGARFTTEEQFAADDRVVVLWRYDWPAGDAEAGWVRGIDVFRVRDGLVSEKRSYVKG